jgi:hypothetical protein
MVGVPRSVGGRGIAWAVPIKRRNGGERGARKIGGEWKRRQKGRKKVLEVRREYCLY